MSGELAGLGNSSTHNLRPEKAALGLFNDLLVDVVGWMIHHHGAVLRINLGIQPRLADKIDNPLLAVVWVEAELGRQVTDVHTAKDLAVGLADQVARGVDEGVGGAGKEEVSAADLFGCVQGFARSVEVVRDVEGGDELREGVLVFIRLLADVPHDVLHLLLLQTGIPGAAAAGDDSGDEVAQDPGAGGLDGVDVGGGEEHVEDGLAGGLGVEEGEEGPVEQHGAVIELGARVGEEAGVNALANIFELVDGAVPVCAEDFRRELAPGCGSDAVVVSGEDAELVEHVCGGAVLAAAEVELAKVVELVDHFDGDLCCQLLSYYIRQRDKGHTPCSFFRNSKLATLSLLSPLTTSS